MPEEGNSLILENLDEGKRIEEEEEGDLQLEDSLDSPVDSISEDEWNRSIIEVEEEFEKVRDLKSNAMELYVRLNFYYLHVETRNMRVKWTLFTNFVQKSDMKKQNNYSRKC